MELRQQSVAVGNESAEGTQRVAADLDLGL